MVLTNFTCLLLPLSCYHVCANLRCAWSQHLKFGGIVYGMHKCVTWPVWLRGSASSESEVCMAQPKLEWALRSMFHHKNFDLVSWSLWVSHGKHVYVHMPTGGGKSLYMPLVPISIGCSASIGGCNFQPESTNTMHVVIYCTACYFKLPQLVSVGVPAVLAFLHFIQNIWLTYWPKSSHLVGSFLSYNCNINFQDICISSVEMVAGWSCMQLMSIHKWFV